MLRGYALIKCIVLSKASLSCNLADSRESAGNCIGAMSVRTEGYDLAAELMEPP